MKVGKRYKGFVLEAMVHELHGVGGFSADLFIEKPNGDGIAVQQFHMPRTFDSFASAAWTAVLTGQDMIDKGYTLTV